MARFGIEIKGKPAAFGKVSTRPISVPSVSTGSLVNDGLVTSRTVGSIFSKSALDTIRTPSVARFIPPLVLKPATKYEQETLRVSQYRVENSTFIPVEKNGISVFRPEIISLMDFKPIDGTAFLGSGDLTESAEQMLKAQYQAIEIRGITIQRLMTDIRGNEGFRGQLEALRTEFLNGLNNTKTVLAYMNNLIEKVEDVKTALDPKKISASSFDVAKYLTLIDFFERKMLYSKSKFANFSDTKIINQLISDFKNALEGYSLSLLDLVDFDRSVDFSPIVIDKTYTQTSNFSFSISSIRSETAAQNANKTTIFVPFLNSLPGNPDDKIKLLSYLISKELRVSRQMGASDVRNILQQKFQQLDVGNPFNNIVGEVGTNIFQNSLGPNSLASTTLMNVGENIAVLPFESIYVDSENERKTYVPGSTYFADSILDIDNNFNFNTQPFVAFANNFDEVVTTAKSTINTLLELNIDSPLSPESVYDTFLLSLAEAISGVGNVTNISRSQALVLSLFRLANSDTVLKNQLFEYLLLLGLTTINNTDQKRIFERLARELGTIKSLSYVRSNPTDNPDLVGGLNTLRPYLEHIAEDIEKKIFSLIYGDSVSFSGEIPRFIPTRTPGISFPSTGPISRISNRFSNLSSTLSNTSLSQFFIVFERGEIKEILLNNATATGTATTNLCKEFLDIVIKLDQKASVGASPIYLIPDGTGRSRFNFLSTSMQMLICFEILSSFVNKYTFADFNKTGNTNTQGSLIMDSSLMSGMVRLIRTIVSSRLTHNALTTELSDSTRAAQETLASALGSSSGGSNRGLFSLFNSDNARTSLRLPFVSSVQRVGNTSTLPALGISREELAVPIEFLPDAIKLLEFKRTLVNNRTKLIEENHFVKNVLHIFDVINSRLLTSKEQVVNGFTSAALANIVRTTGTSLDEIKQIRTPSQIKTSNWLLDKYDSRISSPGIIGETWDSNNGFLVTDRIPFTIFNSLLAMLKQPEYQYKNLADFRVKLLTVGIPANFSKNIADRVSRNSITTTNFIEKEFDVIAIDVYKKDTRFDDLVFRPQRFYFDLSLYPIVNGYPAISLREDPSYFQIIRETSMQDYQSVSDRRTVNVGTMDSSKYSFLTPLQKQTLMKTHIESQLLGVYMRLMSGISIDEEIFTDVLYSKVSLQDEKVQKLIIQFLREVKGKVIPNIPIEELLNSSNLDQETKDTIRLFSYGNIIFQSEFVTKRILSPKLFDRIVHLPINIDNFSIDIESTLSTESGRSMYMKNSVQDRIVRVGTTEYLANRDRNDLVFEEYFVVIESNLRGGLV